MSQNPIEVDTRWWPLAILVLIASVIWGGHQLQKAPSLRVEPVHTYEFSAQRAQEYLNVIASQAHPAGSAANHAVQDYLVDNLRQLGADVEIQKQLQTYEYTPRKGRARFSEVENVVAHFPGRRQGPGVLLMAHYDSVPSGPGAGDNASGVSAVLETMRAIVDGASPLRNSVFVLFSDAEEVGLIGAQAFFGSHRWAEEIGLALNFDSRGSRGPVFMYETSEQNGALIKALAEAAPSPLANSLIYSVFQRMANFSDLSIATAAGKAGMNFAFIDGFGSYHRSTDSADRISQESLQHLGSYALSLVRHFGEANLPVAQSANRVFFNPVGRMLVSYPPLVDWILMIIIAALTLFGSVRVVGQRICTIQQIVRGTAVSFLILAFPALVIFVIDGAMDRVVEITEVLSRQRGWFVAYSLTAAGMTVWLHGANRSGFRWPNVVAVSVVLLTALFLGGMSTAVFGVIAALSIASLYAMKPIPTEAKVAGALWFLVLLAAGAVFQFSGGAHVLLWPLLALSALFAWQVVGARERLAWTSWALVAIPAALLLGSTALNFDLFIGYQYPIASVLPFLLILIFCVPLMDSSLARPIGAGCVLIGAMFLGWLALTTGWSAEQPQPVTAFVVHDIDSQKMYWASSDKTMTLWHRAVLGTTPDRGTTELYEPDNPKELWLAPIDMIPAAAPRLELAEADESEGHLRFRVFPGRAGDTVTLWLPPSTDLLGWRVNDTALQFSADDSDDWRSISGFALQSDGAEIALDLSPSKIWPDIRVVGTHYGMPVGMPQPGDEITTSGGPYSASVSTLTVHTVSIVDLQDEQVVQ